MRFYDINGKIGIDGVIIGGLAGGLSQYLTIIIDDTVLEKSGVRMEGVSRVYDHVKGRCVLGYKLLLCAFFDGKTSIPFDFSLHQEKGKQGDCGLTKQQHRKAYHINPSLTSKIIFHKFWGYFV